MSYNIDFIMNVELCTQTNIDEPYAKYTVCTKQTEHKLRSLLAATRIHWNIIFV